MRRASGKNSLALLCILAGIVYLLILIPTVIEAMEGGIQGAKEGAKSSRDTHSYNDFESDTYFLRLKLKDKRNYYPDSILNTSTDENLPVRFETVNVFYQSKGSSTLWSIPFMAFLMLGALPITVLLVFIPVLFYKLIFSLYRNHVFTPENVKRIEKIGIFCIIVYVYMFLFELQGYIRAKDMIDLEKYKIAFPELGNEILLFGVVALIVATVMKRALAIKEEQDLTI